jgi:hypothetical protein
LRDSIFARLVLAVLAVSALWLPACKTARGSSNGPGEPQVLKWAVDFPPNWDPVVQGSGGGFRVLALAYVAGHTNP